ncbi:ATP-binding cassette domain-containing protein [Litoreibacter halocynthiae]|uniref:ATP-binding cassette domain-containing protein n=1 Tax=Litoreibacter halocynthiae TaxID=1242689 RepID=UPI001B8644DE
MTYLVEMKGIEKRFSGVHALKAVQFDLKPGEVHALMGENGAGKSTLMKIMSGIYPRDGGEMFVDGKQALLLITLGVLFLGGLLARKNGHLTRFSRVAMLLLLGVLVG